MRQACHGGAIMNRYGYSDDMPRSNRYAGVCADCGATVGARSGRLMYLGADTGRRRYAVLCADCDATRTREYLAMRDDCATYYAGADRAQQWAPGGW